MARASQRFPDAVFATSLLEPGKRTMAYGRWIRPIAQLEPCNDAPMDASVISYRLGEIMLGQSASGAARYMRDRHTIAHSRFNDCLFVRLLVEGRLRGRFDGREVQVERGDIYLNDMAQVSELWLPEDCKHIGVMLPRRQLGPMRVHGRVLPGAWLPCRMLREHLVRFIEILDDCSEESVQAMVKATVELLRFCLRADETAGPGVPSAEEARDRIVRYIEQHLCDGRLGPLRLQQVFGISRAQLYRQFAELGGIKHYILNKRLQSVLHDLCNEPRQSIAGIVTRHGFSNERQFQRAFRSRFGMTASEVRAGWQYKPDDEA